MAQLKSELGIVLGAGFETTSHAISWTLGALATHPGVQVRTSVKECMHVRTALPALCSSLSGAAVLAWPKQAYYMVCLLAHLQQATLYPLA
jgi:cytochrome P450